MRETVRGYVLPAFIFNVGSLALLSFVCLFVSCQIANV